jgi:hypothetical protein
MSKMLLGFVNSKKSISFFVFSCFLGISVHANLEKNYQDFETTATDSTKTTEIDNSSIEKQKNEENLEKETEEETSALTTTQRTILKSIVEVFWTYFSYQDKKANQKSDSTQEDYIINPLDRNELGKILSNLAIDECIPNPKSNITQKLVELLVPPIVAFLVVDTVMDSIIEKEKLSVSESCNLGTKLALKLLNKLLMVRFLQTPGTTKYQVSNVFALASAFYKYNKNADSTLKKYIDVRSGAEKLALDQLRMLLQSIDLGKTLSPKHRKKAIGKSSQVLTKPIVQTLISACNEYYNNRMAT